MLSKLIDLCLRYRPIVLTGHGDLDPRRHRQLSKTSL